jgi:hypothetical protein
MIETLKQMVVTMSYRNDLIVYVMKHGGKDLLSAERYLDEYCPRWREANPPTTNQIEKEIDDDED